MRRSPLLLSALLVGLLAGCGDGSTGDESPADSGVRGVVRIGPQCPVVVAGSPCPDVPFEGIVRATAPDGAVVDARTDAQGRFLIDLAPGTYELVAVIEDPGPPSAKPQTVEVSQGRYSNVTLAVDSGIC